MTAAHPIMTPTNGFEEARLTMVIAAVEKVRQSRRGSSPHAAGLLPDKMVYEICARHILAGQSAKTIVAEMGIEAPKGKRSGAGKRVRSQDAAGIKQGKIRVPTLAPFLGKVREAYDKITTTKLKAQAEHIEKAEVIGENMLVLSDRLLLRMSACAEQLFADPEAFAGMSNSDRHVALRLAEIMSNAQKLREDARLKTAQRDKTIATIDAMLRKVKEETPDTAGVDTSRAARALYEAILGKSTFDEAIARGDLPASLQEAA